MRRAEKAVLSLERERWRSGHDDHPRRDEVEDLHRSRTTQERSAWGRTKRTVPITNRHDTSWFESFRSRFALFW
jgi:hypothetical protein